MPKTEASNSSIIGTRFLGWILKDALRSRKMARLLVLLSSVIIASITDNFLSIWLQLAPPPKGFIGAYRRVGPEAGPQVFVAGSSLTVAALYWSEVSEALGQGIETWSVAGSSPDIWEEWQQQSPRSSVTIICISVYDLNEMHVAPDRGNIVPMSQTMRDLLSSRADLALSQRLLTQYPLRDVQVFFPTAGNSDRVLVAVRRKMADLLGLQANLEKHEAVVVEPSPPVLAAGESTESVADWSSGRLLRRIELLRDENRGRHEFFHGPKHVALRRMLLRARNRGKIIVVVLPISREYVEAFLDRSTVAAFEKVIDEARQIVPGAQFVRLDRLVDNSDRYFEDLVHMNSLGRETATRLFLNDITNGSFPRNSDIVRRYNLRH